MKWIGIEEISPLHRYRIHSVWRLERHDSGHEIFRRFWSENSHDWLNGTIEYRTAYTSAYDPDNMSESWGFFVVFMDGQRGACRVRDVNVALADLGYRIATYGEVMGDVEPDYHYMEMIMP